MCLFYVYLSFIDKNLLPNVMQMFLNLARVSSMNKQKS